MHNTHRKYENTSLARRRHVDVPRVVDAGLGVGEVRLLREGHQVGCLGGGARIQRAVDSRQCRLRTVEVALACEATYRIVWFPMQYIETHVDCWINDANLPIYGDDKVAHASPKSRVGKQCSACTAKSATIFEVWTYAW